MNAEDQINIIKLLSKAFLGQAVSFISNEAYIKWKSITFLYWISNHPTHLSQSGSPENNKQRTTSVVNVFVSVM